MALGYIAFAEHNEFGEYENAFEWNRLTVFIWSTCWMLADIDQSISNGKMIFIVEIGGCSAVWENLYKETTKTEAKGQNEWNIILIYKCAQ